MLDSLEQNVISKACEALLKHVEGGRYIHTLLAEMYTSVTYCRGARYSGSIGAWRDS